MNYSSDPTNAMPYASDAGSSEGMPRLGRAKSLALVLIYFLTITVGTIIGMVLIVALALEILSVSTNYTEQIDSLLEGLAGNYALQFIIVSPLAVIPLFVVTGVTCLFWTRIHRASLLELGLRRPPRSLFAPLALLAGFAPSAAGLAMGLNRSFDNLNWEEPLTYSGAFAGVLFISMSAGVAGEISFRGYALQVLERSWGSKSALVLSTLLFSAPNLVIGPYYHRTVTLFLLGLLLGYAFMITRSLWISSALSVGWVAGNMVVEMPFHINDIHGTQLLDIHYSTIQAIAIEFLGLLITAVLFFLIAKRYAKANPRSSTAWLRTPG